SVKCTTGGGALALWKIFLPFPSYLTCSLWSRRSRRIVGSIDGAAAAFGLAGPFLAVGGGVAGAEAATGGLLTKDLTARPSASRKKTATAMFFLLFVAPITGSPCGKLPS